ncbi:MAG TPA: cupin domain-containing protein [Solirubrobacteraceae bacterium]
MDEHVVDDPVLEQRYVFRRIPDHDGGEVLQVDAWVDPGGGVLLTHVHPEMEERFEVLAGQVTFVLGRKRVIAGPGEKATVAPGVRHGYHNSGAEPAHLICEIRSPLGGQLQAFLEDAAALDRAGAFTKRGIPTGFTALLKGAVMLYHYSDMVVFSPFPALERRLTAPLARLGERRGYRAGAFALDADA